MKKNLYPPIVDSVMPNFVQYIDNSGNDYLDSKGAKIYFTIPKFVNEEDLSYYMLVTIKDSDNTNVLNSTDYPSGVALIRNWGHPYIHILPEYIKDEEGFIAGEVYKVQLKFISSSVDIQPADVTNINQKMSTWLVENQDNFSEWSTVTLVKCIDNPIHKRYNISSYINPYELSIPINIDFDSQDELYSFKIFVDKIEKINGYINHIERVYQTEEIIAESNNFTYFFKEFIENIDYNQNDIFEIIVNYTSKGGYSDTYHPFNYNDDFNVLSNNILIDGARIDTVPDIKNGRIIVKINDNNNEEYSKNNLIILRASSESNYKIWEEIKIDKMDSDLGEYIYYDYTAKGGVWYKYCVQMCDSKGRRYLSSFSEAPVALMLEDIFLTTKDMQLKVALDASIDSLKTTVQDYKIDTLGGIYPFICRNGAMHFREFSISGLISSFLDEDGIFLSRERIFYTSLEEYNNYNRKNKTNYRSDYILEREFRERVYDFLNDGKPKLFRSLTEGNILIKLMNVSLTPKKELGRMLYSFSATAYEIDSCSIDNYIEYDILEKGVLQDYKYTLSTYRISLKTDTQPEEIREIGTDIFKNYQNIYNIPKIQINPNQSNIVFYLQDSSDNTYYRYVISKSIVFDKENVSIKGLYFQGVHINEADIVKRHQTIFPSTDYISNPFHNHVYKVKTEDSEEIVEYIAIGTDGTLFILDSNNDIHCPISVSVLKTIAQKEVKFTDE